jgi:hypothetical protein
MATATADGTPPAHAAWRMQYERGNARDAAGARAARETPKADTLPPHAQ